MTATQVSMRVSERREVRIALAATFALHALMFIIAFMVRLHPTPRVYDVIRVQFDSQLRPDELKAAASTARPARIATRRTGTSGRSRPERSMRAETRSGSDRRKANPGQEISNEILVPAPGNAQPETGSLSVAALPVRPRSFPRDLTRPQMTEQQALGELAALLEKHPGFKETILKEMFAGDARIPMAKWKLDPHLQDILRFEKFKSSYEYELMRQGGGGYTGPYDPVHGFDRDKRVGFQVNVIELLKFLKKLLGGD